MEKWNLIIDVAKCEDCNNCMLACKDEHVDNDFPGYTGPQPRHGHLWMDIGRTERGTYPLIDVAYLPQPCMHCDNAPCIKAAENGAVSKRQDGLVAIDPDKARGQKQLVASCPYGAIWWNQELQTPQKCTFCAHLLDSGWKKPRCVQACPTGAMEVIKTSDEQMAALVADQGLEVLQGKLGTKPRVYYKNLYRFNKCFIAGSVATRADGPEECVAEAEVVLRDDQDRIVQTSTTDPFGDFRIDGLPEGSGPYTLTIAKPGFAEHGTQVSLNKSESIGVVTLESL